MFKILLFPITFGLLSCSGQRSQDIVNSNDDLVTNQTSETKEKVLDCASLMHAFTNSKVGSGDRDSVITLLAKASLDSETLMQCLFGLLIRMDGEESTRYIEGSPSDNSPPILYEILTSATDMTLGVALQNADYSHMLKYAFAELPDLPDLKRFEKDLLKKRGELNLSNDQDRLLMEIYYTMVKSYEEESGQVYE